MLDFADKVGAASSPTPEEPDAETAMSFSRSCAALSFFWMGRNHLTEAAFKYSGTCCSQSGMATHGCRRPKRFLPFMEGPRSCAGQALANMNIPATLATLYGRFSFRLADEVR